MFLPSDTSLLNAIKRDTRFFSPKQMQIAKRTRSAGRHILKMIANRPKIHEPLSVQRTNTTRHMTLVTYRPRVFKLNGHALTIRKPAEQLYANYAARQVAAA